MAAATPAVSSPARKTTLAPTRISSGPRCWVRRLTSRSTAGESPIASVIRARSPTSAASPMSRLCISRARNTAIVPSSTPIARVPMASHRGSPVRWTVITAPRATARPISAPASSRRTTGSSGCLERSTNRDHEALPRTRLASRIAVRMERDSRTRPRTRIPTAQPTFSSMCGCRSFSMPW